MVFIAKCEDGTPLLVGEDGVRPLAAIAPKITDVTAALRAAADESRANLDATAQPVPVEHVSLPLPIYRPRKLWGIGLN